jgi:hypothetical protein
MYLDALKLQGVLFLKLKRNLDLVVHWCQYCASLRARHASLFLELVHTYFRQKYVKPKIQKQP